MAQTTLTVEQLVQLHAQGAAAAGASPFEDPTVINRAREVLIRRGEDWAASVLARDLSRRSAICDQWPWLYPGEAETLGLADHAQWKAGT